MLHLSPRDAISIATCVRVARELCPLEHPVHGEDRDYTGDTAKGVWPSRGAGTVGYEKSQARTLDGLPLLLGHTDGLGLVSSSSQPSSAKRRLSHSLMGRSGLSASRRHQHALGQKVPPALYRQITVQSTKMSQDTSQACH